LAVRWIPTKLSRHWLNLPFDHWKSLFEMIDDVQRWWWWLSTLSFCWVRGKMWWVASLDLVMNESFKRAWVQWCADTESRAGEVIPALKRHIW
jgi:hypothetical protein